MPAIKYVNFLISTVYFPLTYIPIELTVIFLKLGSRVPSADSSICRIQHEAKESLFFVRNKAIEYK